jgi:hypothetical protein
MDDFEREIEIFRKVEEAVQSILLSMMPAAEASQ